MFSIFLTWSSPFALCELLRLQRNLLKANCDEQVQISFRYPPNFAAALRTHLYKTLQDCTCVFIWFPGVRVCLRTIQWDVRTFLSLILSYQWIVVNISENHLRIFIFSGVIPVINRSLRTVYRHATTIIKVRRTWICSVNEIKEGYMKLDKGYKINLNILITSPTKITHIIVITS